MGTKTLLIDGEGPNYTTGAYIGTPATIVGMTYNDDDTSTWRQYTNVTATYLRDWTFGTYAFASISGVTLIGRIKTLNCTMAKMYYYNGSSYYYSDSVISSSWATFSKEWATNPGTGNAWTQSELDSAVFGITFTTNSALGFTGAYVTYMEADATGAVRYIETLSAITKRIAAKIKRSRFVRTNKVQIKMLPVGSKNAKNIRGFGIAKRLFSSAAKSAIRSIRKMQISITLDNILSHSNDWIKRLIPSILLASFPIDFETKNIKFFRIAAEFVLDRSNHGTYSRNLLSYIVSLQRRIRWLPDENLSASISSILYNNFIFLRNRTIGNIISMVTISRRNIRMVIRKALNYSMLEIFSHRQAGIERLIASVATYVDFSRRAMSFRKTVIAGIYMYKNLNRLMKHFGKKTLKIIGTRYSRSM